jgi:hypothetical protein
MIPSRESPAISTVPLFGKVFLAVFLMIYWIVRDALPFAPLPFIFRANPAFISIHLVFVMNEPAFDQV